MYACQTIECISINELTSKSVSLMKWTLASITEKWGDCDENFKDFIDIHGIYMINKYYECSDNAMSARADVTFTHVLISCHIVPSAISHTHLRYTSHHISCHIVLCIMSHIHLQTQVMSCLWFQFVTRISMIAQPSPALLIEFNKPLFYLAST